MNFRVDADDLRPKGTLRRQTDVHDEADDVARVLGGIHDDVRIGDEQPGPIDAEGRAAAFPRPGAHLDHRRRRLPLAEHPEVTVLGRGADEVSRLAAIAEEAGQVLDRERAHEWGGGIGTDDHALAGRLERDGLASVGIGPDEDADDLARRIERRRPGGEVRESAPFPEVERAGTAVFAPDVPNLQGSDEVIGQLLAPRAEVSKFELRPVDELPLGVMLLIMPPPGEPEDDHRRARRDVGGPGRHQRLQRELGGRVDPERGDVGLVIDADDPGVGHRPGLEAVAEEHPHLPPLFGDALDDIGVRDEQPGRLDAEGGARPRDAGRVLADGHLDERGRAVGSPGDCVHVDTQEGRRSGPIRREIAGRGRPRLRADRDPGFLDRRRVGPRPGSP